MSWRWDVTLEVWKEGTKVFHQRAQGDGDDPDQAIDALEEQAEAQMGESAAHNDFDKAVMVIERKRLARRVPRAT